MEETISLQDLFKTLKKRAGLIALMTILAITIAGVVSFLVLTPMYQTSTQILVNQEQSEAAQLTNQNIQTDLQLINTYSVIIKSPAILDEVANQLDLDMSVEQLNNMITVNTAENSQVVNVTVQDANPALAVDIANTTAKVFESEIQNLMNVDNVSILSPAVLKENPSPVAPNPMLNMAIAAVIGMMLGVGIAFLLEYLDTTIKDQQDIEEILDIPLLGVISPIKEEAKLEQTTSSKRRAG
ncbi:Tyrosine-protein kinase transmembrane modulator EpsC [Planococcus halocryophilus Or1]|uniref:Capsular biosynthesis protein n=1 Tax=Planococcus halocryophilus TaxID=1215089 RepID=A0A1C7DR60_9BACL|nr:Wzz/FepE/Etk N-terminal domain-containing protein [Planococcus halocryophilus]ANU13965.1 capsular biosynthesis protein [Planococcus halocryophilus]EMF47435.1 Tyrosine-protein kinase transmembrane modulator EpsC [Planococcus halocryophilus Or1]